MGAGGEEWVWLGMGTSCLLSGRWVPHCPLLLLPPAGKPDSNRHFAMRGGAEPTYFWEPSPILCPRVGSTLQPHLLLVPQLLPTPLQSLQETLLSLHGGYPHPMDTCSPTSAQSPVPSPGPLDTATRGAQCCWWPPPPCPPCPLSSKSPGVRCRKPRERGFSLLWAAAACSLGDCRLEPNVESLEETNPVCACQPGPVALTSFLLGCPQGPEALPNTCRDQWPQVCH